VQTLGNTDNLEVFYEYQLYCRSLHISITKFINKTREYLENKPIEEHMSFILKNPNFIIEDRRNTYNIFTIDPQGSLDLDDGFSIEKMENGKWKVSVYIANVFFWLETFGLWKSFSKRVATIYLPDRRRPMLPTILSESLCSLQKNQDRFAFVMDVIVFEDGKIDYNSINYTNVLIRVKNNYTYEDPKMLAKDIDYNNLLDISQKMDKTVKNSHDIVTHWMITMNMLCGNFMTKNKNGIFRASVYFNKEKTDEMYDSEKNNHFIELNDETKRVIKMWNNVSGQYMLYNDNNNYEHEVMNLKSYIHITSPIRRIIDLLNQMIMINQLGLINKLSEDGKEFIEDWIHKLDYINTSMRSIRKVQTDCALVHKCFTEPDIMEKEHIGVVFDKIQKEDSFSYMVYLEELKLLSRITCRANIPNYSPTLFKLYLFEDEDKIKKKIRLHVLNEFEGR